MTGRYGGFPLAGGTVHSGETVLPEFQGAKSPSSQENGEISREHIKAHKRMNGLHELRTEHCVVVMSGPTLGDHKGHGHIDRKGQERS